MTSVAPRATWCRRLPAPETFDPGTVLQKDVGVPRVPLVTPTGLVGVRSVTAGTVDNFVPGLLKCLATLLQGHSRERPVDALYEALPPTPGLSTTTRDPHKRQLSRTLSSSFRREYGCSSSSLTLDGQPLFTNLRTRESTGSLSVHCAISFAITGEAVKVFSQEVKVSRYWHPYLLGKR